MRRKDNFLLLIYPSFSSVLKGEYGGCLKPRALLSCKRAAASASHSQLSDTDHELFCSGSQFQLSAVWWMPWLLSSSFLDPTPPWSSTQVCKEISSWHFHLGWLGLSSSSPRFVCRSYYSLPSLQPTFNLEMAILRNLLLKLFLSWISFLLVCSLLRATTTSLFLPSSSSWNWP